MRTSAVKGRPLAGSRRGEDGPAGGKAPGHAGMMDMTHGPLLGKILLFSLPLMASNLLQLLFNTADIVVVGRWAGHASLAAVGSTACVINLAVNLLVGISVGVNVVIARYLGETGREAEISKALHTAMLVGIVGGTLLGAAGALASGWMLDLISTPADVRPLALVYLRIYFIGTPFMMIYNYGAAALRAEGDTSRPLVFLSLSGTLNVVLNLFFVIKLRMDVAGVALATVISQGFSAALILGCLTLSQGELRFSFRQLRVDPWSLRAMARVGVPAGLQGCLFSLSNVVIQGAINAYDSIVVAGYSAGASIENFIYIATNSFHHACQTFTSQNLGARQRRRIIRTVRICMLCTLTVGGALSAAVLAFDRPLVGIYNSDPAVIQAGAERLWTVVPFYVLFAVGDVLVGVIRGCGASVAPVVINLLATCALRLAWVRLLDTSVVGVVWVYASYPISWTVLLAALAAFWLYLRRKLLADAPEPEAAA